MRLYPPGVPDDLAASTTGARSEYVHLATGVELHIRRHGPDQPTSGPAWVLVHGLASNARLWDGVARRLAAMGASVIAVDQRGHGRSGKPNDGYDMTSVANDLAALVEAVGWQRPILVGQSWGGNVVVETARHHPWAAGGVGCVDGGFIRLRDRFPTWDECASVLAPPHLIGVPEREIRLRIDTMCADWPVEGRDGTMANFEVRPDGTIAPWLDRDRHMAVLRGLWEHDPLAALADVLVPVRFLVADSGEASWSNSRHAAVDAAVAATPVSDAVWFPGAHHDVHAQRPDEVTSVLVDLAARVVSEGDS